MIGIVLSLNCYICEPWDIKTTIDTPILVKSNDEGSVIINGDARTIITLDKNNKVTNKVTPGVLNANRFYKQTMALTDDGVYFVQVNFYLNSPLIESEQIFKSNLNGKKTESLLECSYDKDKNKVYDSKVISLFEKGNVCYALVKNLNNTAISVVNLSKPVEYNNITFDKKIDPELSISFAWYDDSSDKLYLMDQFGKAYSWGFGDSGSAEESPVFESEAYYNALYTNSVAINSTEDSEEETSPVFSDDKYNYLKHKPDTIKAIEGKNFSHNIIVQLRIWLFWLGILVLSILIVLFIVKSIHRLRVEQRYAELKRVVMMVGIGLASMIIVIFYSREIITTTVEYSNATQRIMVQMTQDSTADLVEQAKTELDSDGRLSLKTYNSLLLSFRKGAITAADEDIDTAFTLALISGDRVYPIVLTDKTILSASLSRAKSEVQELKLNECISSYTVTTGGGYSTSRIVYADKDGNAIGILYAYNDVNLATVAYLKTCIDLFIKLFVGALVIVYAIMEIIAWLRGFVKRRKLLDQGLDFQGVALARPLVFLNFAVNAADSALIVLIVKDMLVGTEYENNLILCSLPMTVMALGFLFGGMLTNTLISKYRAKRVLLVSNVLEIVCLIGEAWSVYNKNLLLLLVFMLLMTIFNQAGVYYAGGYALSAPNDDLRRECNIGVKASELAAYAVITIFSGYAVSLFGNHTVYIVAIVPAVISLAIICLNKFDDRIIIRKAGENDRNERKEKLKFLLAPQMIVLIFCAVAVSQLLGGYRSYVFPLFADQGGISKASISNIQVFAKAIVFFSLPLLNKYQKRLGDRAIIALNSLVLSAVFLMFIVNQSVIWAVVTLIFTYVAAKGIDLSRLSIWQKYAIDNGVDMRIAQSAMANMNELFNIFKNPVLAWLLGFGQVVSCVIIGVYLSASAFVLKLSEKIQK